MSLDALNWAFNLQLPKHGAKLVLLTLANYAGDDGQAFPSQKTLSEKSCMSERALRDNLVLLERWKLIVRVPRTRANGSYTTDLFKVNVGGHPVIETAQNDENSQRQILPSAESAAGEIVDNSVKNDPSQRQILQNPAADSAAPESLLTTTFTNLTLPRVRVRERLAELGVANDLVERWELIRQAKGLELTVEDVEIVLPEVVLSGLAVEAAIRWCCDGGLAWFKAKWYRASVLKAVSGDVQTSAKKPSAMGDWRNSPDGVNKRGAELGMAPRVGESQDAYRARVIKQSNLAELAEFKQEQKRRAGGSG